MEKKLKTIMEMAQEAGLQEHIVFSRGLEAFAALVRDDCQKLAFEMGRAHPENPEYQCACIDISEAIIRRGQA